MDRKVKVLLIEPSGGLAGSERVFFDIVKKLKDNKNIEIGVFLPEGELYSMIKNLKIKNIYPYGINNLHKRTFIMKLLNLLLMLLTIIRFKPDIVHINQGGIYKHTGLLCKFLNIPQIVHIRIIEDAMKIKPEDIGKYNIKRIIAISHYTASFLQSGLKSITDIVYDPYIPTSVNTIKHGDCKIVGNIGRICRTKKQHLFVEAGKVALKEYPHLEFHLYGGIDEVDYFNHLKDIAGNHWNKNIMYMGFKEPKQIYKEIDLLVHTCDTETLGRVIIEGIDYGIPFIVPDNGGAYEISRIAGAGIHFKSNDVYDLAKKFIRTLRNYDRLIIDTKKARDKIKDVFSIERYENYIVNLYRRIALEGSDTWV